MAGILEIPSIREAKGTLTVLDRDLPFEVRRVYWIRDVPPGVSRAGHRHRRNRQALVCVSGRCVAHVLNGGRPSSFVLEDPAKALLLEPGDWHMIAEFETGTVLLALASEPYDPDDYISEPPA